MAMTESLVLTMRLSALQVMSALSSTHPTCPTESDVMDLLFLVCHEQEDVDMRRLSALCLANVASDVENGRYLLKKPNLDALCTMLGTTCQSDPLLLDHVANLFHNIVKLDPGAGQLLVSSQFHIQITNRHLLSAMTPHAAIYVADTFRHLSDDMYCRTELNKPPQMLFTAICDGWARLLGDKRVGPHLALMCCAFAYHQDIHNEFVMQGGISLVTQLYEQSSD